VLIWRTEFGSAWEEFVPTYQYVCTECGGQLEAVQKFTDDALTVHDDCGGRLRKVFSPVGIVFKGSGFYRTDSRGSGSSSGTSSSAPAASKDSGTSSASSTDSSSSGSSSASGGEKAAPAPASSSASSSSGEKVA
jgi:putative FmdB family regulatory protein